MLTSDFRPEVEIWESLPNRYSALSLAHVYACVTGLQHSKLYRFGRFAEISYSYSYNLQQ